MTSVDNAVHTPPNPLKLPGTASFVKPRGSIDVLNHRRSAFARYQKLLVVSLLSAWLSGCDGGAELPEVKATFERFVGALEGRDAGTLWELTDPDTREKLLGLVRRIDEAATVAPSVWGGAGTPETVRALAAVGIDLLSAAGPDDDGRGPRIVMHILRLDQLRWTEGSRESLKHPKIIVEKDASHRAIVRLPAGESLAFESGPGGWKSTYLREFFLESVGYRTLSGNLDKLFDLREAARREWRSTLDARSPQGAFNLVRRALRKQGGAKTSPLAMLDDETVTHVGAALETSRKVQRRIQQKTSKALRPAAYDAEKITMFVDARSDIDLFERWATTHPLPDGLSEDEPTGFEADGDARGVVVTEGGKRIPFSRRADGLWGLAWYADAALTNLLKPLEARLAEEVQRP